MKIIDIFDNGGFRSAADDMIGRRLMTLSREMPVAALRRQGPVAMTLAETGSVELLTSEFGFGARFSMPYKLRRLGVEGKRTIIHTHAWKQAEQALLVASADKSEPVVVMELDSALPVACKEGVRRYVLDHIDGLIFHTEADRAVLAEATGGRSASIASAVIAPGFTIHSATGSESMTEATPLTLIWAGRLTPASGLASVVDAMASQPAESRPRLIVAGQGEPGAAVPLLRHIKKLGLADAVEFPGDVALSPSLCGRASALVIACDGDPAASWNIAMAGACGLPSIIPAGNRCRELAGAGAVEWEPESAPSLAAAISDMAARRRQLGAEALAGHTPASGSIDRLTTFYQSLLH